MSPRERQRLREMLDAGLFLPDAAEHARLMLEIDDRKNAEGRAAELPPAFCCGQGRSGAEIRSTGALLGAMLCVALTCALGALAWRIFA